MQIDDLKASVSLREYVEATSQTDLTKYTTTSKYIVYENCPFCNHKDHFAIYNNSNRFCSFSECISINRRSTGDILDFIMLQEHCEKNEAIKILSDYVGKSYKSKKTKLLEEKNMNNNEIKIEYSKKDYDFTNQCLKNIAIGDDIASYYYERGFNNVLIQSYMLAYTSSFNDFLKDYEELKKPKFYSANIFNYVVPSIKTIINDDGSFVNYVGHVMFRADDVKLKELNDKNKEQGRKKIQKYMKVLDDEIFNERYITTGILPNKFNLLDYNDTSTLYIVEGQFDALIIEQNKYHAIALDGVKNYKSLVELIIDNLDKVKNYKFKLALDNDESGETTASRLYSELNKLGLDVEITAFSKQYHDVNDFYIKDKEQFVIFLETNARSSKNKDMIEEEIEFLDAYYEEIMMATKDTCIPTGFPKLDTALGGGLFPGLYVIGGTPGAGKTAIVNVIADLMATAHNLSAMFSLELSKKEVLNRCLSRLSFYDAWNPNISLSNMNSLALSINDMKRHYVLNTNPSKVNMLQKAITTYKEKIVQNRIIVKQDIVGTSASFIRRKVEEIITNQNRKPIVIVDYLQRLKSESSKDNMTAISENIATLKQLSIDYDIPVVVMTSFNRANYMASANLSQGKGSGDIEYTADCIISVQLKGCGTAEFTQEKYDELMQQDVRELELVFLKNRNWKPGIKTEMTYIPAFNVLEEN